MISVYSPTTPLTNLVHGLDDVLNLCFSIWIDFCFGVGAGNNVIRRTMRPFFSNFDDVFA